MWLENVTSAEHLEAELASTALFPEVDELCDFEVQSQTL
jgi:hypothetical protein